MSKKPKMERQLSLKSKGKSNNIDPTENLFRTTSEGSSDTKKSIIKTMSVKNTKGLPKISKMPGIHRNHPALNPKKPKTKRKRAKSPRSGKHTKKIKKGGGKTFQELINKAKEEDKDTIIDVMNEMSKVEEDDITKDAIIKKLTTIEEKCLMYPIALK